MAKSQTPLETKKSSSHPPKQQTFLDHIQELRNRLFMVAACFVVFSAAAYPFVDSIIDIIVKPLHGEQLFYLTPVGGFSFLIKICTYVGILLSLPVAIYHLYRYLQPIMGNVKRKSVVVFMFWSALLAAAGVAFAYFVSLPAALKFLTGFGIEEITAMLTVDAYLSFVITYLLGAAILFQVPLILLIIDSIKPTPPKKLMGYQRFVVLGAFVVAAIISPTPDMANQALLAGPIIAMYQIGIILVWLQHRRRRRKELKHAAKVKPTLEVLVVPDLKLAAKEMPLIAKPQLGLAASSPTLKVVATPKPKPSLALSIDGFSAVTSHPPASMPRLNRQQTILASKRRVVERPIPQMPKSSGTFISDIRSSVGSMA